MSKAVVDAIVICSNTLLAISFNASVEILAKGYFCEICSGEAKKSLGVEHLCKMWGLKKEEILTIGDQNNDIALLQAGGIKVAMGNATNELKELADYITESVYDDG